MVTSPLSEHKQNGKLFRTLVGKLLWTFYSWVSPKRSSNYRREWTWVRLHPRNVDVEFSSFNSALPGPSLFRLHPTRSLPLSTPPYQVPPSFDSALPDPSLLEDKELDELMRACASCLDNFDTCTEPLDKRPCIVASNSAPVKRKFGPAETDWWRLSNTSSWYPIPQKTMSDTRYCFRVWNERCLHRKESYGEIIPRIWYTVPYMHS